jgi:amino acid transporter
MPRILYSVARDRGFFGALSEPFSKLHPRYGTPVLATLFTFVLFCVPALQSGEVVTWVFSATYVWASLYVVFHILALLNRRLRPEASKAFSGKWFQLMAGAGIVLTVLSIYYAFAGRHVEFGGRALLVILVALGSATLSFVVSPKSRSLSK